MTPFDLRGPEFLLFYAVLCAAVALTLVVCKHLLESGEVPRLREVDPYLVAYLRGGPHEALRVAILSLLDRGLLEAKGDMLVAASGAAQRVRRPLERKILLEFPDYVSVSTIFARKEMCDTLGDELRRQRLVVGPAQFAHRVLLGCLGLALLWGMAYAKIQIALARGRHNFGFLVMFALVGAVVVIAIAGARRTALGDRVLRDLRTLFRRLRDRAAVIQPGGATNELALLAGVFGIGALAGPIGSQARTLFAQSTHESTLTSTCGAGGSSCDSSSCGSSCGGGSGCGGCGG